MSRRQLQIIFEEERIVVFKKRLFKQYAAQYQSRAKFLEELVTFKKNLEPEYLEQDQPSLQELYISITWALDDTVADLVRAMIARKEQKDRPELKNVLEKMFMTSQIAPDDIMLKWIMFAAIFTAFGRHRYVTSHGGELNPFTRFPAMMKFTEETSKLLNNFHKKLNIEDVIPWRLRSGESIKIEELYAVLSAYYKKRAWHHIKKRYASFSERLDSCFVCQQLTNLGCGKCQSISYCSIKCQSLDSSRHEKECCGQ